VRGGNAQIPSFESREFGLYGEETGQEYCEVGGNTRCMSSQRQRTRQAARNQQKSLESLLRMHAMARATTPTFAVEYMDKPISLYAKVA
jgi:hypothetical protein